MRRAAAAPVQKLPEFPELTRAEFLCALRAGLIRRIGATRDGSVVAYELTHIGRGAARQSDARQCPTYPGSGASDRLRRSHMIIVPIVVRYRSRTAKLNAIVDTGYEGGLFMPLAIAKKIGAPLTEPIRRPHDVSGHQLDGQSTVATVSIPEAGVAAETIVFCTEIRNSEILLGLHFLAAVHTTVQIGKKEYGFRTANHINYLDPTDLSWMRIPTGRPMTKWWDDDELEAQARRLRGKRQRTR